MHASVSMGCTLHRVTYLTPQEFASQKLSTVKTLSREGAKKDIQFKLNFFQVLIENFKLCTIALDNFSVTKITAKEKTA